MKKRTKKLLPLRIRDSARKSFLLLFSKRRPSLPYRHPGIQMRTLKRWIRRIAAAVIVTASAGAILFLILAYFVTPEHAIRIQSGPPPFLSSSVNIGTGFFINTGGDIATNRHVVEGCHRISIAGRYFTGQSATVRAVPADKQTDLAILHTQTPVPASLPFSDLPWPTPDDAQPDQTEAVRAAMLVAIHQGDVKASIIGYPGLLAAREAVSSPVTLTRTVNTHHHHHFDRLITGTFVEGNSGSPIVTTGNTVAGVIYSVTGTRDAKTMKWLPGEEILDTPNGKTAHQGFMIPAAILAAFANASGVRIAVKSADPDQHDPAAAVVRIFCFHTYL